jgi:hypothetical protein
VVASVVAAVVASVAAVVVVSAFSSVVLPQATMDAHRRALTAAIKILLKLFIGFHFLSNFLF